MVTAGHVDRLLNGHSARVAAETSSPQGIAPPPVEPLGLDAPAAAPETSKPYIAIEEVRGAGSGRKADGVDFITVTGARIGLPYFMAGPYAMPTLDRLIVGTTFGAIEIIGREIVKAHTALLERRAVRVHALPAGEADPGEGCVIEEINVRFGVPSPALFGIDMAGSNPSFAAVEEEMEHG